MQQEKAASLALLAYEKLHKDITNGSLEPGSKLRVADLHNRYGIGLSPLRDALNRLCADGLVVKREQKGFFVSELHAEEFVQITNARLLLEETALKLSIEHGDRAWEERIILAYYRLARACRAVGDSDYMLSEEWSLAHHEFHVALLAACGNEWLLSFCEKLYEQSMRYRARVRRISATVAPARPNLLQEHKDILDACLARDARLAGDLLVAHYKLSLELALKAPYALADNPRRLIPLPVDEDEAVPQLKAN